MTVGVASGLWVLGLWVWGLSSCLSCIGTLQLLRRLRSQGSHFQFHESISILKPLKGLDFEIEKNLKSFFELDYPDFEIQFSVADDDDPVIGVVNRLVKGHPNVRASLSIGCQRIGINPKINNIALTYEAARADWVLISDSNVRVPRNYLHNLTRAIGPDTGIVTSILSGQKESGLGGHLESIFLNTFYAKGMSLSYWLGLPCVVGKTMLFKKSVAQRFGGILILKDFLAEDYVAGSAMNLISKKVEVASVPVVQVVGTKSLDEFWSRHVRWGVIRKSHGPLLFFFEPLTFSTVQFLIGLLTFGNSAFGAATFSLVHLTIWMGSDLIAVNALVGKVRVSDLGTWLLRELLALPIWVCAASTRNVKWRGRLYKVLPGGVLQA